MNTRIAAAVLVTALSQTVAAGDNTPINITDDTDTTISAQKGDTAYWNRIQGSFARDLYHVPYAGPTAVTVSRDLDHSIDRLVFAQHQEKPATVKMATAAHNAGSDVK